MLVINAFVPPWKKPQNFLDDMKKVHGIDNPTENCVSKKAKMINT